MLPATERHGLALVEDGRLREAGRSPGWIQDYEAAVREYLGGRQGEPSGWEPAAAVRQRVLRCILELEERHAGATIAVCGHGLSLSLALAHPEGADAFDLWGRIGFSRVALVERGKIIMPFGDPADADASQK